MRIPLPKSREAHVWSCPLDMLSYEGVWNALGEILSMAEREKLQRRRAGRIQLEYLAARVVVRTVLSAYTDVPSADLVFQQDSLGRPSLASPNDANLDFNVSHTDGVIMVGVAANGWIGIDVEDVSRDVGLDSLLPDFLTNDERNWVESARPTERAQRILRLWTLKEAWCKAVGLGMSAEFHKAAFRFQGEHLRSAQVTDATAGELTWIFHQIPVAERFLLAVALGVQSEPPLLSESCNKGSLILRNWAAHPSLACSGAAVWNH